MCPPGYHRNGIMIASSCQKNAISSIVHCTILCTQVTFQSSFSFACTFADVTFESISG